MKLTRILVLSCTVLGLTHGAAKADYYKLYSPRVEKGELSAEADLNYSKDSNKEQDKYFSQVLALEYGVTDWWMTELGAEIEKENGDNNKFTNLKWENVIAPWRPGENLVDVGFYVELEKALQSGEADNAEAQLLLEKDIGKFVNTANIKLEHAIGANSKGSDWGSGFAWRTKYRYDQAFEPGVEYYADFGSFSDNLPFNNQEHVIGPVIQGKIGPVKYDTGALFGISDSAPDATIKLNLEYEF